MNVESAKKTKGAGLTVCVLALVGLYLAVEAGDLDPPGPPASTMVTLEEIFDQSTPRPPDRCFDNTGNRFVDCGNGTVKDTETGLFWLKDAGCLLGDWADGNIGAAELADGQCGLTDGSKPGDWRLPTLHCPFGTCIDFVDATEEFASIFAPNCPAPFVPDTEGSGCWSEGDPFSGLQTNVYWSSSTVASNPGAAYFANLTAGNVSSQPKTAVNLVWPVRGGP